MTPVHFTRYSPTGSDPTIMVERITHWERIDYNGNVGTAIYLDTGKTIHVGEYAHQVEEKVKKALGHG